MEDEKSSKRKYNSQYRRKLLDKLDKIKNKDFIKTVFKIVNKDIGDNYSENKSGIFFNMNILSDSSIEEINSLLNSFDNIVISETSEDKLTYKAYSENEIEMYNSIGPRLSNQERSILKKYKNETN
tara:strand:- start:775 stop:1152 length:378 start_codon:yes stop_codon:yes gene_type:complete